LGFEGDFGGGFLATVFFLTGALIDAACAGRDRDETAPRRRRRAATRTLGFEGDVFFLTTVFVLAGALAALGLSWACCH
jgi:hypothetical protein